MDAGEEWSGPVGVSRRMVWEGARFRGYKSGAYTPASRPGPRQIVAGRSPSCA